MIAHVRIIAKHTEDRRFLPDIPSEASDMIPDIPD